MEPVRIIEGAVSVLDRNDVDTDQIIPKQFLKRVERTGFGEFLFYDWAKEPGWDLPSNPILAAGRNFGCGSSREHAPWALEDYGFSAVVAPSFADIFFSNCTKIGLLPVTLPEADVKELMAAGHARIDLEEQEVSFAGRQVPFEIDPEIARRLLEGLDDIGVTLQQADAIDRYEAERERERARHDGRLHKRARLGRRHLRPGLRSAGRDGAGRARPAAAARRRDGARRRLRLRARDRAAARAAARGHVVAVDSAPSMVEHAREALGDRATVIRSDLTELTLDEPVDAVFSNAVFHWIADHDRLFARLYAALQPGGRLVAQCGGEGNVAAFQRPAAEVAAEPPYAEHLSASRAPGTSRRPRTPSARLRRPASRRCAAGCSRSRWADGPARVPRTVCLGHHIEALPEELREPYAEEVVGRCGEPVGSTTCG